jgi:hypothetical protein
LIKNLLVWIKIVYLKNNKNYDRKERES